MARILCVTTGTTGIVNASLQVVSLLQASGHMVVYASCRPVGQVVKSEGIEFIELPAITGQTEPGVPETLSNKGPITRFIWKIRNMRVLQTEAVARLNAKAIDDVLCEVSPDVVLADIEWHEFIITAIGKKFPVILLCQWFCMWNRPGLPPIESMIIPGRGFKGSRLGMRLAWLRRSLKRFKENQSAAWSSGFTDRRSALFCYARTKGFPIRLLQSYNWPPPFTYAELPVLSMTAAELEFPHKRRPGFYHIGPMVKKDRADPGVNEITRTQVRRVLEDCRLSGKQLIHFVATSMHASDVGFVRRVLEAVGSRPDWVLVGGLGHAATAEQLGGIPENTHIFVRIPQLEVLEEASCSINHGGINSINECLVFGVPLLVYPGGMFDQNGCAARVAYHGIGQLGSHSDSVETIRDRICKTIADEGIAQRLRRVASRYEGEDFRQRFAGLTNNLISG